MRGEEGEQEREEKGVPVSASRTALTKARMACEQLESMLQKAALDAKADAVARGDGGESEDGATFVKLENAKDAVIEAQKALMNARSWLDAAVVRGWEEE
jgi:hypothetical protein